MDSLVTFVFGVKWLRPKNRMFWFEHCNCQGFDVLVPSSCKPCQTLICCFEPVFTDNQPVALRMGFTHEQLKAVAVPDVLPWVWVHCQAVANRARHWYVDFSQCSPTSSWMATSSDMLPWEWVLWKVLQWHHQIELWTPECTVLLMAPVELWTPEFRVFKSQHQTVNSGVHCYFQWNH